MQDQIEREIGYWLDSNSTSTLKKISSDKANNIKIYSYKDIFMDKFGDPILDDSNSLIGYKLNDEELAIVTSYYNPDNQLCNKVSVKDINSPNESEALITWIDTQTNTGFTRVFKKNKYYYNLENKLINVETPYSCSAFPPHKKEIKQRELIGTIYFETFGSNSGLGYHTAYAGGWATKDNKNLFYLKSNETS